MPYHVYILYSNSLDSFYKGQTSDLSTRLNRHNSGLEKSTKAGIPWDLIWSTEKDSRSEAVVLETKLKNLSRKRTIEFILKYSDGISSPDDPDFFVRMSGC
jgi:putative endonuclease